MNWLIDHGEFVDEESGKVVFSYAHPIFWAPFTLVGDGGGHCQQVAQKHFTTATAMYREMGMTYWLEKAEAERATASA